MSQTAGPEADIDGAAGGSLPPGKEDGVRGADGGVAGGADDAGSPDATPELIADTGAPLHPAPPPPPPPTEPPASAQPPRIEGTGIAVTGVTVATLAGSSEPGLVDGPGGAARFRNPVGLARAPDGTLVVSDFDNGRLRRVTPEGYVTTLGSTPAGFGYPFGLVFDADGRLLVETDADPTGFRDYYTSSLWVLNPESGAGSPLATSLGWTRGLALLPTGELLLTDNIWHVLRVMEPGTGQLRFLAGSGDGMAGYRDGVGSSALFFRPYGAAVLPNGNVVVADARNHCLREVTPGGVVTTYAGQCGQPGYNDGQASEALFHFPQDVAVDDAGEVFVTDVENSRIRLVQVDGSVLTLAGAEEPGHRDGRGEDALFFGQEGIECTPDGSTIYVADGDGARGEPYHTIRVIRRLVP